jgi:hypothetical protein
MGVQNVVAFTHPVSWLAVFWLIAITSKTDPQQPSVALLSRTVVVGVTHCAVELRNIDPVLSTGARLSGFFHGMIGNLPSSIMLLTVAGFLPINSANLGYGTASTA